MLLFGFSWNYVIVSVVVLLWDLLSVSLFFLAFFALGICQFLSTAREGPAVLHLKCYFRLSGRL